MGVSNLQDVLDEQAVTLNRLAAIGEVSAGIAHEIRNPLTTVKGFLQLMEKDFPNEHWTLIHSELDQAIGTIQELLAVSKPDLNNERKSYFNLCTELENVLSLFHKDMYRVNVTKKFYNTKTNLYGKRNQIKRAVFNLLKNAFEAIPGEGEIVIEHMAVNGQVILKICDTGIGIPSDKLQMLGTPFFSMKDTGTGLGLPQVYSTFYEHKASIEVTSGKEGTVFTINMPLKTLENAGVADEELVFSEGDDVKAFFKRNNALFNKALETEASTTFETVSTSKYVTKQDLLDHANQILDLVHDGLTQEIIKLAQERGTVWAQSDVPLISKMEWFYALRKVIWRFLRFYHLHTDTSVREVFEIADRISETLDNFIIHFNVTFTRYRDNILRAQQAIIEELAVPIIPITNGIAVLPLIGSLDDERIRKIETKLLDEIEEKGIQRLFLDLSSLVVDNPENLEFLTRLHNGVGLLGCTTVLTGIRAPLAKVILKANFCLDHLVVEGTLQQALQKENIISTL